MKQTYAVVVLIVALLASQSACKTLKQQLDEKLNLIRAARLVSRPLTIVDSQTSFTSFKREGKASEIDNIRCYSKNFSYLKESTVLQPFSKIGGLRWSDEALVYRDSEAISINGNELYAKQNVYVVAGEKIGDTIKVQCFAGFVVAKLTRQFKTQAYENCVKDSGDEKC